MCVAGTCQAALEEASCWSLMWWETGGYYTERDLNQGRKTKLEPSSNVQGTQVLIGNETSANTGEHRT